MPLFSENSRYSTPNFEAPLLYQNIMNDDSLQFLPTGTKIINCHKMESASSDNNPLCVLAKYVSYLDTNFTHMSTVSYYKIFCLMYLILLKV